jgi:hypothetical protein
VQALLPKPRSEKSRVYLVSLAAGVDLNGQPITGMTHHHLVKTTGLEGGTNAKTPLSFVLPARKRFRADRGMLMGRNPLANGLTAAAE